MRPPIDLPVIILTLAALGLAVLAYLKDPGLPLSRLMRVLQGSPSMRVTPKGAAP